MNNSAKLQEKNGFQFSNSKSVYSLWDNKVLSSYKQVDLLALSSPWRPNNASDLFIIFIFHVILSYQLDECFQRKDVCLPVLSTDSRQVTKEGCMLTCTEHSLPASYKGRMYAYPYWAQTPGKLQRKDVCLPVLSRVSRQVTDLLLALCFHLVFSFVFLFVDYS